MSYKNVILITGARDWTCHSTISTQLSSFPHNESTLLIHGDCVGADKISGKIARQLGFIVSASPADWKKYGRAAGPIRNQQMVKEALTYANAGIDTVVLAFHDDLTQSKGTKNCVEYATKQGLDIIIAGSDEL